MRLSLVPILLFALAVGCAQNVDPKDPEGAYNLFTNALWARDADAIWDRSAPSTHKYFQEKYDTLVKMDETIVRYLPSTDHKIAREQAGTVLTAKVKDGKGLFLEVFKPSNLKLEEKHKVGAVLDQKVINEDETAAELTTLGKDVYYFVKGENQEWFVMLERSSKAVDAEMGWLGQNESALNQTIEDLIDEERKRREAIIEELMRLAPAPKGGGDSPDANGGDGGSAGGEAAGEEAKAPTEDGTDGGQEENPGNNGN